MKKYPFNREEELKDVGMYGAVPRPYGAPASEMRRFHTPITPKENIMRILKKKTPLWMPSANTDLNVMQPMIMPDAYARWKGGLDWFGIDWVYEPLTNAAMVRPGTRRLSDITKWEEEIIWPDLSAIDWARDYEENYAKVVDKDRANLFIIVNGLFERLADLTSFEDAFCYLLEEPEALKAFYDRLTDWHIELISIAKKYYHADIITFHDDMGSQNNSFMSPAVYEEVMLPHYSRITKAAHDMGMYINHHSCGSVINQIPNFIKAGFDFWEGQDSCNPKMEIMDQYHKELGHFSVFVIPETVEGETYLQLIENQVKGIGKYGRFVVWLRDMKADRAAQTEELLYTLSREFYTS